MLQITFLFIGVFILVLVLATIFKRYQRIILWTAGILMFLGVMFACYLLLTVFNLKKDKAADNNGD